jgi:hypothetical protein
MRYFRRHEAGRLISGGGIDTEEDRGGARRPEQMPQPFFKDETHDHSGQRTEHEGNTLLLTLSPITAGWQAPALWCCYTQRPWAGYELRLSF